MMSGNSSRCPFTASQWQELEHQALIFKYMASGAPVPQDLIGPIRRSLCLEPASTSPMLLFHHQPNSFGWGCFQMGFGKKVEDPEPWRCRRTDGKKWRCSKEAFPDSKYCERHMHRGKNRSRKPVEISIAATSTYAAAPTSPSLLPGHHLSMVTATEAQHLLNPYAASSRRHDFFRDPSSSSDANRHGMKSPVDQRDACWRFTPLGLSPIGERRQRSCSFLQQDDGAAAQEEKRRHCFVLGTDIRAERGSEAPQPVSFLSEEWSRKARNEQAGWGAFPMTQLSISMAHYDFQVDSSRSAAGN